MVISHGITFYVDIPDDLSNILRKDFWTARLVVVHASAARWLKSRKSQL